MKNNNIVKFYKVLLFLINFFDGIGLALRYPFSIFADKDISWENILSEWEIYNSMGGKFQIYFHTLFCPTKCLYCNCVSYVDDNKVMDKYLNLVLETIDKYSKVIKKQVDSLYFGGGTYSLWNLTQLEKINKFITDNFNLKEDYVWMAEIHPATITFEGLRVMRQTGITDIMVGIQTVVSQLQQKLNRKTVNLDKLQKIIDWIENLGFRKINMDFMYNLPFETEEYLVQNLKFLKKLNVRNWKIKTNIEFNQWFPSYNVPYIQIVLKKYKNFSSFIDDYLFNLDQKKKIVNDFFKKEKLIFEKDREEIVHRRKDQSTILGIGYGAISYIPGQLLYLNDIEILNNFQYEWYKFKGYKLFERDKLTFYILNNIGEGISLEIFRKFLFINRSNYDLLVLIEYFKDYFYIVRDKVMVKYDYVIDMLGLTLYSNESRNRIYNDLLKKWQKIGFSKKELYNNIDKFLKIYYSKINEGY